MDIVLGIDNAFAMPAGILMTSIIRTQGDAILVFHVLSDGVSEHNKNLLRSITDKSECCSVLFYEIDDELLQRLPVRKHVKRSCYCRLFVTDYLPQTLSKVLYLDSDMLVAGSLKELWDTDVSNCSMAVAINRWQDSISLLNPLGYDPEEGCFNSGMMLINLDHWRKNQLGLKAVTFIKEHHAECFCNDQDALNHVTAGARKLVSFKYNMSMLENVRIMPVRKIYHQDIQESQKNPVIIHYAGPVKPWHKDCYRYFHNYKAPWLYLKRQSPWADTRLKHSLSTKKFLTSIIYNKLKYIMLESFLFVFGADLYEKLTPAKTKRQNSQHKETLDRIYNSLNSSNNG